MIEKTELKVVCENTKKIIDLVDEMMTNGVQVKEDELNEAVSQIFEGAISVIKVIAKEKGIKYPPPIGQFYDSEDLKDILTEAMTK